MGKIKTMIEFSKQNPDYYECQYEKILELGRQAYENECKKKPIKEDSDTDDDMDALKKKKIDRQPPRGHCSVKYNEPSNRKPAQISLADH